jgi:Tfp pilus assembly protein FimV
MADSPLRMELLRKAFIQLNPQAFPGGQASRLRADQVLQVPDAMQLLRAVAMPLLEVTEASRAAPVSAQEQRRWVRFP